MDYIYPPYPAPRLWVQSCYRHDQAKFNLLWLIHPVIDTLRDKYWPGDEISHDIHSHMSLEVRAMLEMPPRECAEIFLSEDRSHYVIAQNWPDGWQRTMRERAADATNRLRGDLPNNVFAVDFQRRVRYA